MGNCLPSKSKHLVVEEIVEAGSPEASRCDLYPNARNVTFGPLIRSLFLKSQTEVSSKSNPSTPNEELKVISTILFLSL
jgi:hypothetical protein